MSDVDLAVVERGVFPAHPRNPVISASHPLAGSPKSAKVTEEENRSERNAVFGLRGRNKDREVVTHLFFTHTPTRLIF